MVLAGLMTVPECAAGLPPCGVFGDGSRADRMVKGVPSNWEGPDPDLLTGHPVVGWVSESDFGVITVGSSSCPPVAGELEVLGTDGLQIEFGPSPHHPCTADMGATTHVFRLPPEILDCLIFGVSGSA